MCRSKEKGAVPVGSGALESLVSAVSLRSGCRRLAGGLGKSAERLGIAHGDVGQDLAVELDAGQLQAVHERAVGEVVLARGGVDARDPQAAEVALAVAA